MKKFRIISLITLIVLIFPRLVEAQFFEWAKGMTGGITGRSISTDATGNSYATGNFQGNIVFSTTTLTSYGKADIFIVKYDDAGNYLWAQKAGGTDNDFGYGITTDATGNSYLTGSFIGTAKFGTTTLTSYGNADIFIAKYDDFGNLLWAKQAGGPSLDQGIGITIDATGNCYISGSFSGTAIFGTKTLTSYGLDDIFIAKYDNVGNCLWVQKAGGTDTEGGTSISTDAIGNCYLTGSFNGAATFGTKTLSSFGEYGYDIFIAKYDNAGNYLWVQKAGGIDTDAGTGIITDATGNSYLTGYFKGEATFGSAVLTSNGGYDIFIAKYDNAGNCLWAQKAGGTNDDQGNGTTTDANGNCYVTGCFNGTATFDTTILTSYGSQDIFIAKYDNAGKYLWTKNTGGVGYDNGNGISESTNGHIYVTGNIGSDGNFGGLNLIGGGGFITKIAITSLNISAPTGSEIWQTNSSHNITWNSIDDGNIKIEITTNDGKNWLTLQNSVKANLGNYTMTVPPLPNSSECKIKLTSLSYGNMDTSSVFTITSVNVPNLTINSPNTKEKWNAGSTQNIRWALTGSIENVKLEYTTNNGNSWGTIINSTLAASENYSWVVPNTPSSLCRIRVADVTNPVLNDISDTLFTIPNNITITTPGGGEKWKSVSSKYITWMSPGVVYVNLFYSTNNGKDWISIAKNITASFGNYSWNIPNLSSSECRIKLEEVTDTSVFNISSVFSIWQPIVSTQTPTVGQINQNFGLTNIDFSAFILVADAITTIFYPYEAPQVGALPNGVFGVSQYYWFITSTSISFFNGVISVPLTSLSGIIDTTKLVWLKRTNPGDSWIDIGGNVLAGNLLSTIEFTSFSEFAIGTTDGVDEVSAELNALPKEFVLEQNYPNPFNPTTTILYTLPFESNIKLVVYNLIGEVVKELLHTRVSAGYQEVRFDAENLSSGIYFYMLYATSLDGQQNYKSVKKMLLLK